MKIFRFIKQNSAVILAATIFFSCSSGGVENSDKPKIDSTIKIPSVSDGPDNSYNYKPQLFRIETMDFKLNKDDLPFPFNESYLREKKIKSITMTMNMNEGKYKSKSDYVWEINGNGQVSKETKTTNGKIDNSIERVYNKGKLLDELNILNPGDKFESAIKKVKYLYANNRLMTVDDILENNDTIQTDYIYEGGKLVEKKWKGKEGVKGASYYSYIDGRLSKIEFFNTPKLKDGDKGAIHTYTYTHKGKLLYGDHWYPGISNDTYIFEFDEDDRLVEITYKIFLKKEELKIPGKTKSYRFEYEKDKLKRINYFMQATDFSQSGTFDFTYSYY